MQNSAVILSNLVAEKQQLETELQATKKIVAEYAMIEAGKEQYRKLINETIAEIDAKVKALPTTTQVYTTYVPSPAKGEVDELESVLDETTETDTENTFFMTPNEQLRYTKNNIADLIDQKKKEWDEIFVLMGWK